MNFNDLKAKALNKKQMRAIKGGFGTCGYKSPSGRVESVSYTHLTLPTT